MLRPTVLLSLTFLVLCPAVTTRAQQNVVRIAARDSGQYFANGVHRSDNKGYKAGHSVSGLTGRDFFVFDLSRVSLDNITQASIRIFNPGICGSAGGYSSPDPSETYDLFSVSTPIEDLRANQSRRRDIFVDLGSGPDFGSVSVSSNDNARTITINLNGVGLQALNNARGGLFAVGGSLTTLGRPRADEFVFGCSSSEGMRQLVITTIGSFPDTCAEDCKREEDLCLNLSLTAAEKQQCERKFRNCLILKCSGSGGDVEMRWTVSEFQPNIREGGRANTIAVDPTNDGNIFVASETGGLFHSTNRGVSWRHVDSLPCFRTNSVAFVTTSPNILIATTEADFKTVNGGGIWRSTNGGLSWAQVALTFPPSRGRMSAYDISIAPDTGAIYVATGFGVFMSTTQGVSWVLQDPFVFAEKKVLSVIALGGNRVIAAGPAGVSHSADGGSNWLIPATNLGAVFEMHALGRSPLSSQHAYLAGPRTLFHTEDGGANWTQIASAPIGGNCGGIPFVKAVERTRFRHTLHLYYSNGCRVARLVASISNSTEVDYDGIWQDPEIDHGDTRDLAFDNLTLPLLLATDGGLHQTTDGGNSWTFIGGGRNGYNALQINEIQGQYIEDIRRQDLYFGTQDNHLWASGDMGATWINGMCCEGHSIQAEQRVKTASRSQITNVACDPCFRILSDPLFAIRGNWPDAPAELRGPVILRRSMHIQNVNDSSTLRQGFAATNDLGVTWHQFATFAEEPRALPHLGSFFTSRIIYQAYRVPGWVPGGERLHLLRIQEDFSGSGASVFYPTMNNFEGLGVFVTYTPGFRAVVFAVDPGDPFHLIAPEVFNHRVMETHDGGENWTEVNSLTSLVTDGGRLVFERGTTSLITSISFSPQDPRLVVAGTFEGGIYLSTDNGANWTRLPGSERVTFITGFHWNDVNDVIVSTYGRGLWRLRNREVVSRRNFPIWCRTCVVRPVGPVSDPAPFEDAILVYEGRVLGVRQKAGVLREVFVTPGSSVVFAADNQEQVAQIKVTRTKHGPGFGNLHIPTANRGALIEGLVFDQYDKISGAVFGKSEMQMMPPSEPEPPKASQTKSPIINKPYLRLITKEFDGAPVAAPNELIEITGTNFRPGDVLEIFVDDQWTGYKVQIDERRYLKAMIRAPVEMGLHTLTVRTGSDEKSAIDGSIFLVRPTDDFRPNRRQPGYLRRRLQR